MASLTERLFGHSRSFHHDEGGKVTLLASLLMLGLVSLAGLIGNVGHAAKEKLETQNAADSVAYSSSLWMARGMNALTATNHMLGEATAIVAVHEALGGPELDHGVLVDTSENRALNGIIRPLAKSAPIVISPFGYTPPPIPSIDRRVVNFVTNRTSPTNDRMSAFATIYDARMTLKRQLAVILPVKTFANAGFFVPPPWGYATAAVAYGVHIAGTVNVVLIGKEWFALQALEGIAKAFKPMKRIIETQLIPTLSAHADFIAGYDARNNRSKPGIVNKAVERVALDLQDRFDVEASVFPKFDDLRLPVVPEPKPRRGSGRNTRGWGSDNPPVIALPELNLDGMKRRLDKAIGDMQDRINKIRRDIRDLDKFEKEIDERLEDDDVSAEEKRELEREKRAIERSRQDKKKRLADIEKNLDKLKQKKAELERSLNQPLPTKTANPSVASIPREMNQDQERYTQWVRATYPQVDGFRAPIRAWLDKFAKKSKAASYFDKWTNRYTLVKTWQFRSGRRTRKSGNRVSWGGAKKAPLRMFVMRDSFRGSRDRKGREPWTGRSETGKRKAEELFTLIGVVHRDYQPLFSERLYPAPSDTGMTAYAQAIFYNANRQQPSSGRGQRQAKLGWDTLNWDPSISVPEWGAPPLKSAWKWPWEAFDGSTNQRVARVKLNWQAKLMPVRTTRLKDAAVTLNGDARKNVEHAAEYFDELGTH